MNCIESIDYFVNGEWKQGSLLPPADPDVDPSSRQTYDYETPGLLHEGGRPAVAAALIARDDINGPPYAAYQFQLYASPFGREYWDPPINRCDQGDPRYPGTDPCWRAPLLAQTDYRFTFRTSRLVPIFVQTSVVGMTTSVEDIPGGRRVSITGRPGASQWALDLKEAERLDRFDAVSYDWQGFFSDARARNGVLAECQGLGIATAYSNGNGGAMPEWDGRTGTLSFGTGGFHYGPDGKVYRGLAEVFVPGPLARCMWKVDPRQTARMEIEVFGEDGGEVAGTKSIAYDAAEDLVKMIAVDFTYSEKDIIARPAPVVVAPGQRACDATETLCVSVDKSRRTAKVTLANLKTATREVIATALRGTEEDRASQVTRRVTKGRVEFTVRLNASKARGQVWVVRTRSDFISSFELR